MSTTEDTNATRRGSELSEGLGPTPQCPECNDTGERDSGGTHPWGEPIYLACDCKDAEVGRRWRADSGLKAWFPITAERLTALEEELRALADAADDVGVRHFDTDWLTDEVQAMKNATLHAREVLGPNVM